MLSVKIKYNSHQKKNRRRKTITRDCSFHFDVCVWAWCGARWEPSERHRASFKGKTKPRHELSQRRIFHNCSSSLATSTNSSFNNNTLTLCRQREDMLPGLGLGINSLIWVLWIRTKLHNRVPMHLCRFLSCCQYFFGFFAEAAGKRESEWPFNLCCK